MKSHYWIQCSALALGVVCFSSNAQHYYGNGYTLVNGTTLQQGNDIHVLVYKNITAKHVKAGLQQLLKGSGWQLADNVNADPSIHRLYRQRYPDFKRQLNPIKLSDALTLIAGKAWDLVVDPVNKLVSFQLAEGYRCFDMTEAVCE